MAFDKKIETERLILRIPQSADIPEIEKMHADPQVMALSGAIKILDRQENHKYCQAVLDQWERKGYGMYALIKKDTEDFCGLVGLRDREKYPGPELSWILSKSKWGHGYASEAALAVKDEAFYKLNLKELYHFIDPVNTKSIRLAERLGAIPYEEIMNDKGRVTDIIYVSRP